MRDVSTTPLLERESEERHAQTLHESREAFAALVLELPTANRKQVLNGNPEGPETGHRWRLRDVEDCFERMATHLGDSADPRVRRILDEARRQKRLIDESRDALILANLRFVAHLAKQMAANTTAFLDLIQEGNLGLLEAVERFEYKRGYRFSTYAFWWIRKAQHLAIAGKTRMIYIPAHVWTRVSELRRASAEMTETLGRNPTVDELAERLCLPPAKVRELQSLASDPAPLEEFDDNGNSRGPLRRLADGNGSDPLQTTLNRELRKKIQDSLRVLNPQESLVIRLRFGIGRKKRLTLKQVGGIMNLSRERVRQIEMAALRKLQQSPEARALSLGE
jgi:RNA polymerase primary sigma factor